MLIDILMLIGGLVMILAGATALTDGASALARRMGVSDLIVGLTVVAFGTSAPELVISMVSAIEGNAGLAIGNAVGSNIFNICAIIGITAIIRPVGIGKSVLADQIPLVILSALVLLAMGNTPLLDGTAAATLTRVDGIVLLLFFAIFMRYTFAQAHQPGAEAESPAESAKPMSLAMALLRTAAGLALLIFGGEIFVDGASGMASKMGVSDAVIGLTIVAVGTSLPELATSIAAALKGHTDLAVGNVIGSNIFNIFFVLGCASCVSPLGFGTIGNTDLLVLTLACLLFWIFGRFFGHRTINRAEGATLFAIYVAYTVFLVINA